MKSGLLIIYLLCLWCSWNIIFKPKVIWICSYVIFYEIYSFAFYIYVYDPLLSFCEGCKFCPQALFFFLPYVDVKLFQHHLLKRLSLLYGITFALLLCQRSADSIYEGLFWALYFVSLISLSFFANTTVSW